MNIVERLRVLYASHPIIMEAANEIERVRAALDGLLDCCDAVNDAQHRQVIDPHAMRHARDALEGK